MNIKARKTAQSRVKLTHTPGPWRLASDDEFCEFKKQVVVELPAQEILAPQQVQECDETGDAHLIAAAPELLEACEHALEALRLQGVSDDDPILMRLAAAIEKATVKTE
jgi:hypothetical protein